MALTEQQLDELLKYLKEQIQYLVEQTDAEDDKAIQRLYINIQNLYKELNVLVADQLPETLLNAYTAGLAQANSLLTQAGISVAAASVSKIMQAPVHVEAINNIVSDTLSDLAAAFRTAEAYNYKEIDNVIKEVHDELANGMIAGLTREQIAKRVGQKFGQKGMTAFITKDGKHLPLDFYSRTVTRTKIQTATNHAHLNRYEEHDVKHVIVVGSIPTCAHCAKYRGRVFATSRGDSDFPYLNLHATFPLHPNCRCNFRPFILKFKTKEEIEDAKKKAQEFKQLDEDADVRSDKEKSKYSVDQKAKRDERKKRLAYNNLKARLGDNGPKDYNEFKNASKLKYHDWVAQAYKAYDPNKDTSRKPLQDDEDNKDIDYNIDANKFEDDNKKHSKEIINNMNDEELSALKSYSGLWYEKINEYTRKMIEGESIEDDTDIINKKNIQRAKTLINMFDNNDLTIQNNGKLFRGVGQDEVKYILDKIESDNVYKLENFKSTSAFDDVAKSFVKSRNNNNGYIIEYRVPKGIKGISVSDIATFKSEDETILQAGQEFELVEINEDTRTIVLEGKI